MTVGVTQAEGADEASRLLPGTLADSQNKSSYGSTTPDAERGEVGDTETPQGRTYSSAFIAKVVVALLIGVFTSHADGSLVLATHPVIASEFDNMGDSSWLFIGFMLAGATTQALYGKLSDIFGRKSTMLVSYGLFAVGCGLVGIGQSMGQVILGRVISGSGGSGMSVLASVIITDLAPLRDVASWQSYMNVIATVGRSIGGPLGGWLSDTIGWRWSFLGQAPIFFLAMVLCWWLLPSISTSTTRKSNDDSSVFSDRLRRIDGLGALLLGAGLLALLMPLEIGGTKIPWTHPLIFILFGSGIAFMLLFVVVESSWAVEPILPLRLLRERNVTLSLIVTSAQSAAQLGMMYTVPLYFQVTDNASSTIAGAHLFPAVIGNTVGGIVSGLLIKRSGRYKPLIIFAAVASMLCYSLLVVRWHGHVSWLESLYVFPGGLGTGMAQSAVFIALQASILPEDKATATSVLFLCWPVGAIVGMAGSTALMQGGLKTYVYRELLNRGMQDVEVQEIVRKATENIGYIHQSPGEISKVLIDGYVKGIEYSHGLSILLSFVALIGALFIRERRL